MENSNVNYRKISSEKDHIKKMIDVLTDQYSRLQTPTKRIVKKQDPIAEVQNPKEVNVFKFMMDRAEKRCDNRIKKDIEAFNAKRVVSVCKKFF